MKKILLVFILIFSQNIFSACDTNHSYLLVATNAGDLEKIKEMINCGADINIRSKTGDTPLIVASYNFYYEIAKFLIEKGAYLNLKEYAFGNTALIFAIQLEGESADIAGLLIEKGADTNVKNNEGVTALIEAINSGSIKLVKLLIEKGKADVNLRDDKGNSALMYAAQDGSLEIVQYLVEKGAYRYYENIYGQTALLIAQIYKRTDVYDYLSSLDK